MNLRPRRKSAPDLNLTPLIDVVFLLLIFFMVSTTFIKETRIKVDLPRADTEERVEKKTETLDVTIDVSGRFYVNQDEVINTRPETLRRAMEKAASGRTDVPVTITADARTPHQAVVTVMDAARQLGLLQIRFTASQRPESQ
jgi:biopolymer transport protein ExbD